MNVYVVRYQLPYGDGDLISVYDSFQGVLNRLQISELNGNFDEDEKFIIECMEVTDEATSLERLNRIREHHEAKRKDADNNNKEENN